MICVMCPQARAHAPTCMCAGTVGVGHQKSYGRRQREVQANRLCYVVKLDAKRTHRKSFLLPPKRGSNGSTIYRMSSQQLM